MTVDASVQQLIDTALAPLKAEQDTLLSAVQANTASLTSALAMITSLAQRVAALEAGTVPAPPPVTPPPARGIPAIPAGRGTMFRKDFGDGSLAPFRPITYPNLHPGDLMIQYGTYATSADVISVHDGYLDLKAIRQANGTWKMSFVGTGKDGTNQSSYKYQYGTSRIMARFPGGTGKGDWRTIWLLFGDSAWSSPEIDWPEAIGGKLTANLHGSSSDGQKVNRAFPDGNWHEYGIVKQPAYIAFTIDGAEVGRANVAMSANMALFADAKVGLSAPDATTPSPLALHLAWWTVDPA